jgi:two-component system, LytTR family, sensor kinase
LQNPITNNKRAFKFYLLIWLDVILVQVAVMYFFYKFPLLVSVVDGVIYNTVFASIAVGLWYTIRFLSIEKQSVMNLIFNHFATAVLVIIIWLLVSAGIIDLFFPNANFEEYATVTFPWKIGLGVMYYLATVLYFYLNIYYNSFKDKELKEAQLSTLVKETELNMLRSQLNPHFIFNSLNSISSLTIIDPQRAQEMVVKLSTFMRYALRNDDEPLITLEKELEHSLLYLEIEKVRFGERLMFDVEIADQANSVLIPCMILQPLLENAIKHGVYESSNAVSVALKAKFENDFLIISIVNDYDSSLPQKVGTGSGLKNTKKRLAIVYYGKAELLIEKLASHFKIHIKIPLTKQL